MSYINGVNYCFPSSTLEIQDAIQRLGVATSNNVYDKISVFSTYWGSDDTGADKDSSLFIETIQKLHNVDAYKYILSQEHTNMKLARDMCNALPSGNQSRKLFIFHYAGHSIANTGVLVPTMNQKHGTGPEINLTSVVQDLKTEASAQSWLDVLFIVDSCCSVNCIEGDKAKGARVEFVVASCVQFLNSRTASDASGRTFTQCWCAAFNKLLDTGRPFVSKDITNNINPDHYHLSFPALRVLREGLDLPIAFSSHNNTVQASLPSYPMVVTVFYIKEHPDSPSVKQLIEYLDNEPVPITVLGTVPVQFSYLTGTLLLLSMPGLLQELLTGSRVAIMIEDEEMPDCPIDEDEY